MSKRERERGRERNRGRASKRPRSQRAGAGRPLDGSVTLQSAPGPGSEVDRIQLKDGPVNKAESSFLKSSYPTLRPSWTLCPQLFHPPACTRQRDKRGSPRMASLLLTAQGFNYSSMQPCFTK